MQDKKHFKKILADMTRRMRRHLKPPAEAAAPTKEDAQEPSPKAVVVPPAQIHKRLRWAYLQKKGAPTEQKFQLSKGMEVMPGWSAQALKGTPRRFMDFLKRHPGATFGLYGILALALIMALPRLIRSMHISQWLPIAFNSGPAGERWSWEKRGSSVELLRADAEASAAPSAAPKDRLPVGAWELPAKPTKSFVGILTPQEIKEKYPRNWVQGLAPQLILEPGRDSKALPRSMIVLGGDSLISLHVMYDGKRTQRPLAPKSSTPAESPPPMPVREFRAVDQSQDRTLPNSSKQEELSDASLAHLDDIERELKEYAKNGQWTKLHKIDNFTPPLPESAKQMLAQSQAYGQLVQTRLVSYQDSFQCQLCSVEERVNNNRATYFGELYK